jgi:hypothetical protein
MNPEVTVPLTIGPAAADFEEGQVLAADLITSLPVVANDAPGQVGDAAALAG